MVVDGVEVYIEGFTDMQEPEIKRYIEYLRDKVPDPILNLKIRPEGNKVGLMYSYNGVKFERIRRITGYLVGTTDRWNNAKRSEERERVKHSLSSPEAPAP